MKSRDQRKRIHNDHWVGLDVSKRTFDAAVAGPDQRYPRTPLRALPWKSFPRTRAGVVSFLAWLDEQAPRREARVVMEATGQYSVELASWLLAKRSSLRPAIENPKNTKAFIDSLNQRNKTDGLDARGLAFYGVERCPAPYEPLSKARQELRDFNRYRDALVAQRTAVKNRSHERCSSKIVARMQKRQLRQLNDDIKAIERETKRIIREDESFKRDFELLTSIDGVGPVTATTVLAEIGDLRRFERARQLTAYAGVSPSIVQSGTSVRGKSRMCKRGNQRVRQALYLSAMATLNTKSVNSLSALHYRLREEGKHGKAATRRRHAQTTHRHARRPNQRKAVRSIVPRTWKTKWTTATRRGDLDLNPNRLSLGYEMISPGIANLLEAQQLTATQRLYVVRHTLPTLTIFTMFPDS